jgi:hypothetical protein
MKMITNYNNIFLKTGKIIQKRTKFKLKSH